MVNEAIPIRVSQRTDANGSSDTIAFRLAITREWFKQISIREEDFNEETMIKNTRWLYVTRCLVFRHDDIEDPVLSFQYAVDTKFYTGKFVPEGWRYRVYGSVNIDYGIEKLEDAIAMADRLLKKDIDSLTIAKQSVMKETMTEIEEVKKSGKD